jgi:hypothetical protein
MCQLQYLEELGEKNTWLNRNIQYFIRKYRFYKRKTLQAIHPLNSSEVLLKLDQGSLKPGDMVRVRSKSEIRQTLNRLRKTKGCTFQPGMWEHCLKEYKVYKKVDYFFDESKQKMCKCKDLYLLEGSCCNGVTAYLRPCDRNCFYFWHISWLENINH